MAKEQSHVGTTNTTPGSCVDCTVTITRRVSYTFLTGKWPKPLKSETSLAIPYALAINGTVKDEFKKRAGVLSAGHAKSDIFVEPGQTVSLYLNSDAAPRYRTAPVFAVTPNAHDVEVVITEKRGLLGDKDALTLKGVEERKDAKTGAVRKVEVYEGTLTGDIWAKVSHKYTLDEAKALIPAGTVQQVREAVLKIYGGSLNGNLSVTAPKPDAPEPATMTLVFEDAENPKQNITGFNMYRDGLPRVHPQAWLVMIEAALATGVGKVTTSSAWRPMLGSMAHRTGLGLDVTYLAKDKAQIHLNRKSLQSGGTSTYVSQQETELYAQKKKAEAELTAAEQHLKALQNEQKKVKGKNPLREQQLPAEINDADARVQAALTAKNNAENAWNKERDKNEPETVKSYRAYLSRCKCVGQLFDPWFMDSNTQDDKPADSNKQVSGNETLHATHLHITVFDPSIAVK